MPASDVGSLVRAAYRAFAERRLDDAAEHYAAELELRSVATDETFTGRAGYLQYAQAWAAAFPDASTDIAALRVAGATATVEYVLRGTHSGTLIGSHGHVPPTWAQVEVGFCDVLETRDGLIARVRSYFDTGSLLRQMGLLGSSPLHPRDRRATLDLYALEPESSVQQRNKTVVRRFVDGVLNQHDRGTAAEMCVPNLAWHGGVLGELRDLSSYQEYLDSLFAAFPDLRVQIEDVVAEGDRVAVRVVISGTHRGEFHGIAPTGKRVSGTGTSSYRVVDGRIVEEWWQPDLLGMMKQLDVLPATVRPGPAGRR